jgi:hypothetical protein
VQLARNSPGVEAGAASSGVVRRTHSSRRRSQIARPAPAHNRRTIATPMTNGVDEPDEARRLVGRADTTWVAPARVVEVLWVIAALWWRE